MGLLWGILKNKWVACKYFFCFLNIVLCTFPVYTTFLKCSKRMHRKKVVTIQVKPRSIIKNSVIKKLLIRLRLLLRLLLLLCLLLRLLPSLPLSLSLPLLQGCGSGSAWIRIHFPSWIRIQEGKFVN